MTTQAETHDAPTPSRPARDLIVVDVETNGLDLARHQPVEVAWHNLTTGEQDTFIPAHNWRTAVAEADIDALRITRYIDRIAGQPQADMSAVRRLWEQFTGPAVQDPEQRRPAATLVGSNPRFDAAMLRKLAPAWPEPWHHRLLDISAYAAGALGLDELPGLARLCEILDVDPPDHTAGRDVEATVSCLLALQLRAREVPF